MTVALQGDFGKPRPAVVIQADAFIDHATVTVLPVTSTIVAAPLFRISLAATEATGLRQPSQVMVDKAVTLRRDKLGPAFGRVDASALLAVERSLAVFLGIAK